MTRSKVDLDQLTNRQMYELERASGMRFRDITSSDILSMAATAWVYVRENGMQPLTFGELLDMTPQQLADMLSIDDDDEAADDAEGAEPDPQTPSPTTP